MSMFVRVIHQLYTSALARRAGRAGLGVDAAAEFRLVAGHATEPEPGFTTETGNRTFAFSELMVRKLWAGRGIAHALHDELLRTRPETRATLLALPDNTDAYQRTAGGAGARSVNYGPAGPTHHCWTC